ncbi:MAG: iron-sulfur cluster assembly scaffold protein [Candidatus Gracilibacteria bacterium]|nr:iron-sulfur cluster assembly scaffold protein [Candidatus Gracilibacteria bacterium]MDD3120042.1 iron-sulfur cluster assembly scaffold protein [Candidatus Gracilibacteria bacterium]MDD4530390.1 iron-sulfur cluster assembly scaffold protein [Candidatus Gracilibacteria bacterium]
MSSLYNETIIAYSKNPPNRFAMEDATIKHFEENRVCGDSLDIYLKIEDNLIKDFSFEGDTTVITTAGASALGEAVIGMTLDEILVLDSNFTEELIGKVTPRRRNASVLGLLAVRNAIHEYLKDGKKDDFSDVLVD